ncbi:MAG: membrane protein insertion efficiency factor YidD [Syntrophobacteraceae bacterium CG23_combo_of_CG06-09_8_20_14_all_50_8]|nr:MAG: membrane protein insertion efficiency factor YidD [Syntrophobacteraceae bacterium CG23_combo_of_CG06-09_8_20_14_all_50_8]
MTIRILLGKSFIYCIRIYQFLISPFFAPCCRFYPSCSEYAIMAIRTHGPFKGLARSSKRLLRCHPFNPGGYDPVK